MTDVIACAVLAVIGGHPFAVLVLMRSGGALCGGLVWKPDLAFTLFAAKIALGGH